MSFFCCNPDLFMSPAFHHLLCSTLSSLQPGFSLPSNVSGVRPGRLCHCWPDASASKTHPPPWESTRHKAPSWRFNRNCNLYNLRDPKISHYLSSQTIHLVSIAPPVAQATAGDRVSASLAVSAQRQWDRTKQVDPPQCTRGWSPPKHPVVLVVRSLFEWSRVVMSGRLLEICCVMFVFAVGSG